MSHFTVVVAPVAAEKIGHYGDYIAEQSGSVETAERWVDQVYNAIATLEVFPRRFALAEEDAHRSYEIRRLIFGDYLALYTIDDVEKTVRVVGFRHGARLPRPDDLPADAS
jgi:plasmid stabilization system protein ParE